MCRRTRQSASARTPNGVANGLLAPVEIFEINTPRSAKRRGVELEALGMAQIITGRSPLKAALRYAARGWPVFPVWPRIDDRCGCGKADCKTRASTRSATCPEGFKDATTDEKTIRRWWREYPDAGIGMPTGKPSGMIVIDIDRKEGRDGREALRRLKAGAWSAPQDKDGLDALRRPSSLLCRSRRHSDAARTRSVSGSMFVATAAMWSCLRRMTGSTSGTRTARAAA